MNWTHGNNFSDQDVRYIGWIRALDKIAQLPVKTVVPAHGELGDVDLLRRQRDFIADMWKQVKQGLKAGKSPAELTKTLQFTGHGIFARDRKETEDMIESMCERAQTQPETGTNTDSRRSSASQWAKLRAAPENTRTSVESSPCDGMPTFASVCSTSLNPS